MKPNCAEVSPKWLAHLVSRKRQMRDEIHATDTLLIYVQTLDILILIVFWLGLTVSVRMRCTHCFD